MTGFGEASTQLDGAHYAVELRSLNNRFFKAIVRLPNGIASLEAELESLLRNKLSRGSLTLTVKIRLPDAEAACRINDQALLVYLNHLETIHAKFASQDHAVNIDLTALLALPGVMQPPDDEVALLARARPVVRELTGQACDRLIQMRCREGQALAEDLQGQCRLIREHLGQIIERAPQVIDQYHQRLRSRIGELMARAKLKVAEPELIREVALFAERADIGEETARTGGHLDHFNEVLESNEEEPAGRTLDFLAQEMLREANTIASKSNDAGISRAVVQVKGAIDRIKEQVQNVE